VKQHRKISVDGYVTVLDKDKSGNPLQVALDAADFSRYIVNMDKDAQQLLNLIDNHVHISGLIVSENSLGNPIIKIKTCRVIAERNTNS